MPPRAPEPVRYGGRLLNMKDLVSKFDPNQEPPWRVEPLVIDGTLTVLAGKMGRGKTWVMHEAANAVARGGRVGDMRGKPGRAGIIDAEMGEYLTTQRFAQQGYSTDVAVLNAVGLNLKTDEHRAWIESFVREQVGKGGFLGIDSLKRLAPTSKENESDEMSKIVSWLGWLAKDVGCAGLLLHHAGWQDERIRGSSAIGDPADAVWHLTSEEGRIKLDCNGKDQKAPRYCAPPQPIYFRIKEGGGLEDADKPRPAQETRRETILDAIKNNDNLTSTKAIQDVTGIGDKSVRDTLKSLVDDNLVEKDGLGRFVATTPVGVSPQIS